MKRPGLLWCLVAACGGALLVVALQALLWPLVGWSYALRAIVVGLPLAYVMWLLGMARARVGRVVLGSAAVVIGAVMFFGPFSLPLVMAVEGGLVWIVRSLCFHRSVLGALADGAVALAGLAAGVAAFASTRSLPAAAWSALLVQAAFVYIPDRWGREDGGSEPCGRAAGAESDRFRRAYDAAEGALREIAMRG